MGYCLTFYIFYGPANRIEQGLQWRSSVLLKEILVLNRNHLLAAAHLTNLQPHHRLILTSASRSLSDQIFEHVSKVIITLSELDREPLCFLSPFYSLRLYDLLEPARPLVVQHV